MSQSIVFGYAVGQRIECRDPASSKWRPAYVPRLAPTKGRPGYYIGWTDIDWKAAQQSCTSPSSGGWTYEACMRQATGGQP